ncbi:AcrR family transcriptional regulator [Catenuloplanes nepalensis]|uniref:AcrR family transcriptional regulator n=1 Tax=Catenuloplanes nepalensis TaxID=587533 RepID=A0ABT9N2G7_9ACTN|nr:TetR/AcrR family transcriptional regulator [Catenuloplanes nepalensis]MDP9797641.1 AcrR family transcriptional regulator [Catenuloplanes nepalensis]
MRADVPETGSRARTRRAILDAAIIALGRTPAASLGEIATAAGVGRTTLHRYFPDRSDLLAAVNAEGVARIDRAVELARLPEGTGGDALVRLAREYFDLGDLLSLLFSEPQLVGDPHWEESADACDPRLEEVIARGHRDGTIDPELPPGWVQSLIWSQLYAGWGYAASGASRHEALRLVLRTLTGALTPRPEPAGAGHAPGRTKARPAAATRRRG